MPGAVQHNKTVSVQTVAQRPSQSTVDATDLNELRNCSYFNKYKWQESQQMNRLMSASYKLSFNASKDVAFL